MYIEDKQIVIKIIVKTDKIITGQEVSTQQNIYYRRNQPKVVNSSHTQIKTCNEVNSETQRHVFINHQHHERKHQSRTHEFNLKYQNFEK